MSKRKRPVLTRGETMFWENAHVIAVLIGMLALLVGSQVKPELNLLLVLLLGLVPGAIVWVARTLWKPRPVALSHDAHATSDRYKSSALVVDEIHQSKVLYVWYVFAVGAALGLVATFVYRGDFEVQERLAGLCNTWPFRRGFRGRGTMGLKAAVAERPHPAAFWLPGRACGAHPRGDPLPAPGGFLTRGASARRRPAWLRLGRLFCSVAPQRLMMEFSDA